MDQDTASRFVSALVQSIQALCHGYVEFSSSIEIVGHIYLNVDKGSKFDYIVNEEVNKDPGSLTTVFHTNSYHSVPPCKQLSTTTRLVDTNEASTVNRTLLQQSVLRDLISRPPPVIDTNLTSASSEFVLKDDLHSPRTMDSELNSSDESLNKRTQQTSSSSRRKRKKSPQRGRQGTQLSSALDPVVIKQEYGTSSQNSFIVENMINGEEHSVEEESLLDDEPCENETDSQFKDHEPYPVLMHAKLESGDLEQFASSVADAGDASPFATGPFAVSRHGGKRKRCHCCPQKLDNKYKDTCSNCGKNVCKAHSKIFCSCCLKIINAV